MKIGLDTAPAALRGTYFQHLASVLARYAPEHEYIIGAEVNDGVDLYHGFRSSLPLSVHLRRVPSVMTVPNLNFLRYPHLYTFAERLFVLTLYRRALRRAGRVITVSAPAREELSERLNIDPSKIEVMVPLAVPAPRGNPSQAELEHVRRKYALPEHFILMIGTVEPRHNHQAVFAALADAASPAGVVVCGRRTAWSDYLLGYARARRHRRTGGFHLRTDPFGPSGAVPSGAGLRLSARRRCRGVGRPPWSRPCGRVCRWS